MVPTRTWLCAVRRPPPPAASKREVGGTEGCQSVLVCPAGDHRCPDNQFQCKNKKCIPVSWHCDGVSDCSDGSDEDADMCSQRTCRPGQFQCANGRCLPANYVCDAQDDCGDGSDEPFETCSGSRADVNTPPPPPGSQRRVSRLPPSSSGSRPQV